MNTPVASNKDLLREAHLKATQRSDAHRLQELHKGNEKRGFFGFVRRRFTRETPKAAFAAFGGFTAGIAALVSDEMGRASQTSIKLIQDMLTRITPNASITPAKELTEAFDGASIIPGYDVTKDVYKQLEADQLSFEEQLAYLSRQNVPDLTVSVGEAFERHQDHLHGVAKNFELRVLFDTQGNVYYAHDMAKVTRLSNEFDGRSAVNAVQGPSVQVMVFTASANPSKNSAPDYGPTAELVPAPAYRPH